MAPRYKASIDIFSIDCETIDDRIPRALVRHEIANENGAALQDMGLKARTVRLRCYWWSATYDAHFGFLNYLQSNSLYTLTHPIYGVMQGSIETVGVHADDRQQTAEVDINFVEEGIADPSDSPAPQDVTTASENAFVQGQYEMVDAMNGDITSALGSVNGLNFGAIINPLESFVGQILRRGHDCHGLPQGGG